MSFYINTHEKFVWCFQRVGSLLTLYKLPGDYQPTTNTFHLSPGGRERLEISLNVFNGWLLNGGIFTDINGHPRALALQFRGEGKANASLFARTRLLPFVLATRVPGELTQAAITPKMQRQRSGMRYTDAEWEAWSRQQRQG